MADPRQCGRCGFGPVDHQGCDSLSTHHNETTSRGFRIQNDCLRCGWFVYSLREWPRWDGELHTEQGRALYRQRTWCEVVVTIKASSKALVVPYTLLLLGDRLWLPNLAALLACSYLIPWCIENAQLFKSLASPPCAPPRRIRARAGPARGAEFSPGAADCGGARPAELPEIGRSEALEVMMASTPDVIFLNSGAICSVCLDEFSEDAARLVTESSSVEIACKGLQVLDPSIVALRCGHPLHVECATAAVSASSSRHVRCPLCRQPVTLAGEATANMFS
ncbi:Uncharacterized protein SCF082_LOCUS41646 [Durusdinium trenchii]|uniref:RING-type domain-containing protein n=1 Tax=Durusdinium trenchii TaxID=1381693 RepID=A0ABP0QIY4_9DINO